MRKPLVILLHGHGAHPLLLAPLKRSLERAGFAAHAWAYRSLRGSIERHAAALAEVATALGESDVVERLHFVGHSMGAIVVRRALGLHRPEKLGRVVLLAPPNRGARLADFAVRLFGDRIAAGRELCSRPDSYVNALPPLSGVEVGVLAARWDHIVAVRSTHLDGEKEHRVVSYIHTLPLSGRVHALVAAFLATGSFDGKASQ